MANGPNVGGAGTTGGLAGGDTISPTFFQNLSNFFEDPNVIRALGELGAIAGEDSGAAMLGNIISNLQRRRAVQRAGAEQTQRNQSFQDRLIQALSQGGLLSPTEDNNAFDRMDISGDGDINLRFRNTPQRMAANQNLNVPNRVGEQMPLEAIRAGRRGDDLPGFQMPRQF